MGSMSKSCNRVVCRIFAVAMQISLQALTCCTFLSVRIACATRVGMGAYSEVATTQFEKSRPARAGTAHHSESVHIPVGLVHHVAGLGRSGHFIMQLADLSAKSVDTAKLYQKLYGKSGPKIGKLMESHFLRPFAWTYMDGADEKTMTCWNGIAGEFMSGGFVYRAADGSTLGWQKLKSDLQALDIEDDFCVSLEDGAHHISTPGIFLRQDRPAEPGGFLQQIPMCLTTRYHEPTADEYIIVENCGEGEYSFLYEAVLRMERTRWMQDYHKWVWDDAVSGNRSNGFIRMGVSKRENVSRCVFAPGLEDGWDYVYLKDCPNAGEDVAGFQFDYDPRQYRIKVRSASIESCLMTMRDSTSAWDYVFVDKCENGFYGGGRMAFVRTYQQPFMVRMWEMRSAGGYSARQQADLKIDVNPITMEGSVSANYDEPVKPDSRHTCRHMQIADGYCFSSSREEKDKRMNSHVVAGSEAHALRDCCDDSRCKAFSVDESLDGAWYNLFPELPSEHDMGKPFYRVGCFQVVRD